MTPSEKLKTYEKSWTEDGDLGEGDEDGVLWLIQRCKTLEAALGNWIAFEDEQIAEEGPYAGQKITALIAEAKKALAEPAERESRK